jgi:hypothetical protein
VGRLQTRLPGVGDAPVGIRAVRLLPGRLVIEAAPRAERAPGQPLS